MKRTFVLLVTAVVCSCGGQPDKGTDAYGRFLLARSKALAEKLPPDPDVNLFTALYSESYADAEKYFLRFAQTRKDAFGNLYAGAYYGHFFAHARGELSTRQVEQAKHYLRIAADIDTKNAVPSTMLSMLEDPLFEHGLLERSANAQGKSEVTVNFYAEEFTASMVRALQKLDMLDSYDVIFAAAADTPVNSWGSRIHSGLDKVLSCHSVRNFEWMTHYVGTQQSETVFHTMRLELSVWQALARTTLSKQLKACEPSEKNSWDEDRTSLLKLRDESKAYRAQLRAGLLLSPPLPDEKNREWDVAKFVARNKASSLPVERSQTRLDSTGLPLSRMLIFGV